MSGLTCQAILLITLVKNAAQRRLISDMIIAHVCCMVTMDGFIIDRLALKF